MTISNVHYGSLPDLLRHFCSVLLICFFSVDPNQLKKNPLKIPGQNLTSETKFHPDHFVINSIGDTIATGTPQEISGTVVTPSAPRVTNAGKPRMRDNAQLDSSTWMQPTA